MSQNESLGAPSWEEGRWIFIPWDEEGILGLTDGSSLCLTPSVSALSAGCRLEGKASQALGKAVELHPFQSFQYSLGLRRLQLLNWTPTPRASM